MKKLLALAMLAFAGVASADTAAFTTDLAGTYCGNALSGSCVVLAEDTGSYTLFWYWNGSTGNMQVTQKNAAGLTTNVYSSKLTSSPREGVDNVVLIDALGNSITVSYVGHTAKRLVRSGHNYYVFSTYVDAGTLTR